MNEVPRTVVITGGNGFVGTHLRHELEQEWPGCRVEIWDLPDVDIADSATYQSRLAANKPEWIIHLAAIASVPFALEHPEETERVNVAGTKSLFESLQSAQLDTKVLFVSTADIYGKAAASFGDTPLQELELREAEPANPYGASKWRAEEYIEKYHNDRAIRVRPFPHIGPGQGLGFVTSDFASQIATIEHQGDDGVLRVGNLEAERDFTDVRDVVRAYRLLMEQPKLGEVFHVATGEGVAIKDVLTMLLENSTADIRVESDPSRMRPSDIPVLVGSAEKLTQATRWQPRIPMQKSLEDILNYWRDKVV